MALLLLTISETGQRNRYCQPHCIIHCWRAVATECDCSEMSIRN